VKKSEYLKRSLLLSTLLFAPSLGASEFIVEDINATKKQSTWIALPYVFSSDSMGLTAGVVGIFNGFFQPQMTIVASVYGGEKLEVEKLYAGQNIEKDEARTTGGFLAISGYKAPFTDRLFLSLLASYAYYPKQRLYLDGSNDSERNLDSDSPLETTPLQTQGYNN